MSFPNKETLNHEQIVVSSLEALACCSYKEKRLYANEIALILILPLYISMYPNTLPFLSCLRFIIAFKL